MASIDATDSQIQGNTRSRGRQLFYICAGIIILMFIMDDVIRGTGGGGIFSIASALHAASAKTRAVDVDSMGFLTPIIAGLSPLVLGVCYYFKIDITKGSGKIYLNGAGISALLLVLGGSFILASAYGERLTNSLMVSRGYTRCNNLDHSVGHGKGKIWFICYELNAAACRSIGP